MKRLIYILLFSPLLGFGQYYDETFIYDCIIDKTNCNPDQCKNNWDERK